MKSLKQYVFNVLIVIDCGVNVVLLGGSPDDTISGRSQRGFVAHRRAWTLLHNLLDRIQKNHCEQALANDLSGADRHTEALDLE
jgi:hypothetical protein